MADVNKLSEGTVADAKAALGDLSDAELRELHDAEEGKDDPRSTLLDAIHVEQDKRKASEDERPLGSDKKPIKQAGDSVNRDSAQNVDDGRKARLETMSAASDNL